VVDTREVADPFAEVEALRSAHSVPKLEGLPGFTGGLVGWFGFECIGYIEPRLARRPAAMSWARRTSCCWTPTSWRCSTISRAACT
jgi:anthranilate/para-aminobenzoate synthase component I